MIELFKTARSITITIDGKPIPQPRGKIVIIRGRPSVVVPAKHPIHAWRAMVADAWLAETDGGRFAEGVAITASITIVAERPERMRWKRKPTPRVPDTRCVGDPDNYAKAVLDALNGVAYHDDCQIHRLEIERWIAAGDEAPHASVTLTEVRGFG